MENGCRRAAASADQWFDRVIVEPDRGAAVCSRTRPSREGSAAGNDLMQVPAGYRVDGGQDAAYG